MADRKKLREKVKTLSPEERREHIRILQERKALREMKQQRDRNMSDPEKGFEAASIEGLRKKQDKLAGITRRS